MSETHVQVAVDGSGKKIRNDSLTESQAVDASGNAQSDLVRYQQVVRVAGDDGDYVSVRTLEEISVHLERQNDLLELILAALS